MAYTRQINRADSILRDKGVVAKLKRPAAGTTFDGSVGDHVLDPGVKVDQADIGTLTASAASDTFVAGGGNLTLQGFAAGQEVKLWRADGLTENRGPWTVDSVTATTLKVTGALADMSTLNDFVLYATKGAVSEEELPLIFVSPRRFQGAKFADGALQIEQHTGILASGKSLTAPPTPGLKIEVPGVATFTVKDYDVIRPDGVAIVYEILAEE